MAVNKTKPDNQDTLQDQSTLALQDFTWEDGQSWGEEDGNEEDTALPDDDATDKADIKEEEDPFSFGDDEDDELVDRPKTKAEKAEDDNGKSKEEAKGKEDKDEEDDKFFNTLYTELKEKGIFQNVELKDDEEITEERFFELQEQEVDARVQEAVDAWGEELDEDGKKFLKFKMAGGNTADFFAAYSSGAPVGGLDPENEDDQDRIIRHYCSTVEGLDAQEIEEKLEWLEEKKKKKSYAENYMSKITAADQKNKENALKEAEEAAKKKEEDAKKFVSELQQSLSETNEVGDFSFNTVNKKELLDYITKPTHKVGKNRFITGLQAELGQIFQGKGDNSKKLLLLANLVKTNFDVSELVKQTTTNTVKTVKSKLQHSRSPKPKTSGDYTRKTLADIFK